MRYTRYDFTRRKRNDVPVLFLLISLIVVAIFMGSIIFNLLLKSPSEKANSKALPTSKSPSVVDTKKTKSAAADKNNTSSNVQTENYDFIAIQAGYFSEKKNAGTVQKELKKIVNPFIIKEKDKYRVMCGIYNSADYDKIVKKLKSNKVDTARVTYNLSIKDNTTKLIAEMIKGNLRILMEFVNANVQFKTEEYKKWVNGLKHEDEKSGNYKLFEAYKTYINKLPKEMKKSDCDDNYEYIYNLLTKISSK